jgi:hypothetical protein
MSWNSLVVSYIDMVLDMTLTSIRLLDIKSPVPRHTEVKDSLCV